MTGDGKYPETDPDQTEDRDGPSAESLAVRAAADNADGRAAQTEPPFSDAFGGGRTLVDRDDDRGSGGVDAGDDVPPTSQSDARYGDDPRDAGGIADDDPGRPDGPDPGYAAFADELDDPLADWPAPDTPLDSLPELRDRRDPDSGGAQRSAFDDDPFGATAPGAGQPGHQSVPPADDFAEAAFFDDPPESDPTDDYAGLPPREAKASDLRIDRDEPAAPADPEHASERRFDLSVGSNDIDSDLPPGVGRSAATVPPPEPPAIDDGNGHAFGDRDDLPPVAENDRDTTGGIDQAALADDREGFVDDFLNDLDDFDDPELAEFPPRAARETAADAGDAAEFSARGRAGAQDAAPADDRPEKAGADDQGAETRIMSKGGSDRASGGTEPDTGMPWGMIALVAVALLLLAAGGFGVVQQRSSLKEEIRDLQAQLATAVAPEEAAAGREQQRRLEVENEALSAEIAALEAENASLTDQLSSLEAQLEEQLAAQESAAQEARAAAAEASARQARGTAEAAEPSDRTADASGWFVNFGSYAQEAIARRWADRLEVSNGRVVVQEARAAGRTLYRVRVVGLADRDAAERTATMLERQHQLPRLWVGRN